MRKARMWIAAAGISLAALSVASAQDQRQDQTGPARGPVGAEKAQPQEMRDKRSPRSGRPKARRPRGEAAQAQEREPVKDMGAAEGETQKPRDMGAAQNERQNERGDTNRKMGEAGKNGPAGADERNGGAARRDLNRTPEGAKAATETNRDTTKSGDMQGGAQPRTNEAATGGQRFDSNRVHAVGGARIPQDKAAEIANDLSATSEPRHLDMRVNVGMPLPGEVDIEPLPPSIVEIMPEYRGYDYVYADDEVVIIDPSSRRVVEMISEGGGTAINEGGEAVAGATRVNPCGP